MRLYRWRHVILLILGLLWFNCRPTHLAGSLSLGKFSDLALYRHSAHPQNVAIFISGDGGWDSDLDEVANELSNFDCLVIGVDIASYLEAHQKDSTSCMNLASEYHKLVQSVEDRLGYEHPVPAVVIGHSAGASMVYAILMQARPGSFRGGISLGFSPGYESPRPFCDRPGFVSKWNRDTEEFDLETGGRLTVPWIAISGTDDTVCPFQDAMQFVQRVPGARFVSLPGADHSINAPEMVSALKQAFLQILNTTSEQT